MALSVHINVSPTDQAIGVGGDWIEFAEGIDQLIFTAGNTAVIDGADIPTQSELISAGVILTGVQIVVDDYFLQDTGANLLKSIDGMGNLNKRYVIGFEFDAATASEPTLEVYDDSNLNSSIGAILGSGTPSNSFIRGITTTDALPGANWITGGTRMAGSSEGNFLYLNNENGYLATAENLYANICIVIPASQTTGFSASPVFVVKWLAN